VSVKRVATGVNQIGLGGVNAFLLETDDGLVLIDTGFSRSSARIAAAFSSLGRSPSDVRAIIVTHLHGDHTGCLAELKRQSGGEVWMHAADAALVRAGVGGRQMHPGPGLLIHAMAPLLLRGPLPEGVPVPVEHEVGDGEVLPFGDLRAVHTPGHTAGHLALLLPRDGGVLFVGDAASRMTHLGMSPIYEDVAEGRRSLAKLAALDFEIACFSHGRPIVGGADRRFRARWASAG
jgi:glyoxylase-like metal-dependent hydrolase (beta-lactamase superfamily II)